MDAKQAAAARAVQLVENDMIVGLGSGSTASIAIRLLGDRVKQGLRIRAVASSLKSEKLAQECGISLFEPARIKHLDIALDGADEVDAKGNLLKGGGGSLLREKIVAFASQRFYVMVDESKIVRTLGAFPLPVEITPFGLPFTIRHIRCLGVEPVIRMSEDAPFKTDNGNHIADCAFGEISDPAELDFKLKMIPGVVETGLFSSKIVTSVFVGNKSGDAKEIRISK